MRSRATTGICTATTTSTCRPCTSMRRTATRIRSGCASSARTTARRPPTRRSAPRAGATSYVDTQFGSVLAALEQCGFADDTIVIVTSDHGDMLGERGLVQDDVLRRRLPRAADHPCAGPLRRRARVRLCRTSTCCRRLSTSPAPRRPAAGSDRWRERAAPARHAGARRRARRIPGGRRGRAGRDDPQWRLEVRALPARSRPAVQPVGRPARADEPGRHAGSGRRACRVPRAGRAAGTCPSWTGRCARASGADASMRPRRKAAFRRGTGSRSPTRASATCAITSARHARGNGAVSASRALSVPHRDH